MVLYKGPWQRNYTCQNQLVSLTATTEPWVCDGLCIVPHSSICVCLTAQVEGCGTWGIQRKAARHKIRCDWQHFFCNLFQIPVPFHEPLWLMLPKGSYRPVLVRWIVSLFTLYFGVCMCACVRPSERARVCACVRGVWVCLLKQALTADHAQIMSRLFFMTLNCTNFSLTIDFKK